MKLDKAQTKKSLIGQDKALLREHYMKMKKSTFFIITL